MLCEPEHHQVHPAEPPPWWWARQESGQQGSALLAVSGVMAHKCACHWDPRHPAGFGLDSGTRRLPPPLAMTRWCQHAGLIPSPSRIWLPSAALLSKPRLSPQQQAVGRLPLAFGTVFPDHPSAGHRPRATTSCCSLGLTVLNHRWSLLSPQSPSS